jgi:hypothetical protein
LQTKNVYFGKLWNALERNISVYFTAILFTFWSFSIFYAHFGIFYTHFGIFLSHLGIFFAHFSIFYGQLLSFLPFGMVHQEKSGNPGGNAGITILAF